MSGAATASRGAAKQSGEAAYPPPVTRGESPQQAAKVDWINATFPAPSLTADGFIALLARMLGRPVSGLGANGLLGFESSIRLEAHHGSQRSQIGTLAFGGESQRGRWLFQLTGTGCGFVEDWEGLRDLLESLDAKITRLDLAVDFLNGEHTVDEAVTLHGLGGFSCAGRPPSTSLAGDWMGGVEGRTLYVGKATNGKMLRVYEKGRQLGDANSDWTRFEVQLGARDRVIPFDAMTDRDAFFAGCYPALESMVLDAARHIGTAQQGGAISAMHALVHLKRSYGKWLNLLSGLGAENAELVEEVRVIGTPRRFNLSSMAAGLTWAQVLSQYKRG